MWRTTDFFGHAEASDWRVPVLVHGYLSLLAHFRDDPSHFGRRLTVPADPRMTL